MPIESVAALYKVGFHNKGAALMMRAIIARLPDVLGPHAIGALSVRVGSRQQRQALGLWDLALFDSDKAPFVGPMMNVGGKIVPSGLRRKMNLVLDREISLVLDASGFSYSDQWGAGPVRALSRHVLRWKRTGKTVILLPQALGPFEKSSVRDPARQALSEVDWIYARDPISLQHVMSLGLPHERVSLSPDITFGLDGAAPPDPCEFSTSVCIVPNQRMIDKTGDSYRSYITFLKSCIESISARGLKAFFLVHDPRTDLRLAEDVLSAVRISDQVPIYQEEDPVKLKGIVGSAYLVIGSRFHALANALSQGVPAFGTGWSHKYQQLFSEFNSLDCLMTQGEWNDAAEELLSKVLDREWQQERRAALIRRTGELRSAVDAMWLSVASITQGRSRNETN